MYIDKSKKIVIKIGSSILIDEKGKTKKAWLKEFVQDIKLLLKKKKQIVIVSSGAIAMGCEYLGIKKNGLKVDKSQAVASIGQIELMDYYKRTFDKNKIKQSAPIICETLEASLSLSPYFISVVAVVSFSLTIGTIPIAKRLSIVRLAFIDLLLCSVSSSVSNI